MYYNMVQVQTNFAESLTLKHKIMEKKSTITEKTQVYNLIILDKSGSMECIKTDAINGYNETLGSIRAAQLKYIDTQEHYISLAAFCSCGVDLIYDKTPIKDAEKLTAEKYEPCCCTPLFDAIGITIKKLKNDLKQIADVAVLVTIITDGYENASKEWNGAAVKKLIEECKEEGWMFSFIGAGEDVVNVATTISITNTVLWEQTSEGTKTIFENENEARERYYSKMHNFCCSDLSLEEKKAKRKTFSAEFYKKDKK